MPRHCEERSDEATLTTFQNCNYLKFPCAILFFINLYPRC